ncbi:CRAL-TRIO domain-containing protein [Chloropicon primus]|uniref:CRAL-TRIO domain-containing protein n=2 Tax=Chloropicon primus TaxID=1764295 RepID=A0A5B8MC46_9CHLO|nr:CRAL-TRIO domain-containing protein [Chloropicon primus]UPQ97148.1 CRAL-TRIO domain-containing protein [Chloropicon primus]|eukprot:QDZ17933.1 CRAL-TRIO domain-containing protein [Chloropicon primus]
MWCCGAKANEEPEGSYGSKVRTAGENGHQGHDKGGAKVNGSGGDRRESVDSDVYFDAEEFFVDDDGSTKAYHAAKASAKVTSHAVSDAIGNGVSEGPTVSPAAAPPKGEKTKETLALEAIREFFAEYDLPDQTYCRFLRARHWDVPKAQTLIQNYLDWRAEMDPPTIKWKDIAEEFETGKVYRLSLSDFKSRQVVILRPGKQNTKNHLQQMKQLVYTMESAIGMKAKESRERMETAVVTTPPEEQLIVLLDFTGYTLRNAPPFKTSLETLKILQDHYCERLGEALLLNPPGVFRMLWKLIRPFIDKRTLKKINFLPKNFKECDLLQERFNLEELDVSLGGTGDLPFDFQKYGELMMSEDEKRLGSLAVQSNPIQTIQKED